MNNPSSTGEIFLIAGKKTNEQWLKESETLKDDTNAERWKGIFEDYFMARLHTRYLEPIRVIQENRLLAGEGFSIVAIQCSLIEFLQSTLEGKNYKRKKPDEKLFEYNKSAAMFKLFLTDQEPFKSVFTKPLADDFYENVRCPILHEARTIGWRIHEKDPLKQSRLIDPLEKIIYRNDFQAGLKHFFTAYGESLQTNKSYQKNFINKFNALAKS